MSTYQLLENAANKWPDDIAMVDAQGSISYQQLYQQTEALKIQLCAAGLGQGMGLAVMGRNGRFFVAAMFAGMGCGATVLPLSHQLKAAEVRRIIDDTRLHAILDDLSGVEPVAGVSSQITFAQQVVRLAWTENARHQALTPLPDAAFIRYTSGTTGVSKGVVLSHEKILQRVEATQAALQLSHADAVLWVLPMAFHFLVTVLVYIRYGVRIIICKDILAQTLIDDANLHKATLLYAAPMHYRLLAADSSGKSMPSLKYAISTSSGISSQVAQAFKARFNIPLTQAYGIIEAGLPVLDSLSGSADAETIGIAAKQFEVAILNAQHMPVNEGEEGQLAIRGPGMFDAYLQPWSPAEQFMLNGWFKTGDLARKRVDGKITLCGREKSMINVAGNKAFPEEIETVLDAHPDIKQAYVFGQAHPLMGEIVCAQVVLQENAELNVEALLAYCRKQLSTYKVPQRVQQVKIIEFTRSGKIKRFN